MHFTAVVIAHFLAVSAWAGQTGGFHYFRRDNVSAPYAIKPPPLTTDWTYKVGTNPWPEYPRPLVQRSEWQNLNGVWKYQNATSAAEVDNPPFGTTLSSEVLVPSCLESGLSGIQTTYAIWSWFSTTFTTPNWSGQRVLLNFGAVDYEATVFINGKQAGFNRGGYFEFTIDATDYLSSNGTNELCVSRQVHSS